VKIHRILLFCFLFAFTGQLVVFISFSNKAVIECCDSDDDSDDSEDTSNECWDSIVITSLDDFTIYIEKPAVLIAWKLLPTVSTEWHNAIDNPPEIS